MGITLLTKEITPKNIFYRNEIQYRDDVPTLALPATSISIFFVGSKTFLLTRPQEALYEDG